jgi:hypothetical protein
MGYLDVTDWPDPVNWSAAIESRSSVDTGGSVAASELTGPGCVVKTSDFRTVRTGSSPTGVWDTAPACPAHDVDRAISNALAVRKFEEKC